jgi:hypothetical protein
MCIMETLPAYASYYKSHFPMLFVLFALSLHATMLKGQSDSLPNAAPKATARYFETADTLVTIRLNVNNEFEYFKQEGDNFVYDILPNQLQ